MAGPPSTDMRSAKVRWKKDGENYQKVIFLYGLRVAPKNMFPIFFKSFLNLFCALAENPHLFLAQRGPSSNFSHLFRPSGQIGHLFLIYFSSWPRGSIFTVTGGRPAKDRIKIEQTLSKNGPSKVRWAAPGRPLVGLANQDRVGLADRVGRGPRRGVLANAKTPPGQGGEGAERGVLPHPNFDNPTSLPAHPLRRRRRGVQRVTVRGRSHIQNVTALGKHWGSSGTVPISVRRVTEGSIN